MNIGNQISTIRKEQQLTQEQFRSLFHVTRQTVSNWENEKSYPDLQMLIDISNQFEISLDTLIKEDSKMVKTIDKERVLGKIKKEKSIIDFFTGAGTGIIVSCLLSPDSIRRTVVIIIGLVMIGIGWYKKQGMIIKFSDIWKNSKKIRNREITRLPEAFESEQLPNEIT